jgi:hypothetical protein
MVSSSPGRFSPGRRLQLPIERKLGGPQIRSGRFENKKFGPVVNRTTYPLFSSLYPSQNSD